MIIDSLKLYNYGTYAGEHELSLAPLDRTRPVTLIGGLNGAGKTTLLEAMQLALHGRASPIATASSESYERLLMDRISRLVPTSDGASIELCLRAYEEGRERVLTVRRAWSVRRSKFHEDVAVFVDGVADRFLSENWVEASDRVFPSRLASLFFFDGEKIEALAHPESAREAIRTAVESLLGLDVVRQLETDLGTLTRMKVKATAAGAQARSRAQVVERLEAEVGSLRSEVTKLQQHEAAVQNDVDKVQIRLERVERELERSGGLAYENRHHLEGNVAAMRGERAAVEDRLRRLAEGDLPLALLRDQIADLLRQLRAANEGRARLEIDEALRSQSEALIALLRKSLPDSHPVLGIVQDFFVASLAAPPGRDRLQEIDAAAVPSAEGRLSFLDHQLGSLVDEARDLIDAFHRSMHALADAERELTAVPEEAVVQGVLAERRALKEERLGHFQAQAAVRSELDRVRAELERTRAKLEREVREQAAEVERAESEQRVIDHAVRAVDTLGRFRTGLLGRQADRLGEAVLARFRQLVRKDRLVSRIRVRSDDFGLDLFDDNGTLLAADRLSAGERQLLAVALLWGLSNASGRALPVVVDTPLGRLDSKHRRNLVERYLPRVSHQTIVLSTDEEVDAALFARMEPHVSRSYLLAYDDDLGHTVVTPGYFREVSGRAVDG